MRIVDQQAAVPIARGALEQPERDFVGLADRGFEMVARPPLRPTVIPLVCENSVHRATRPRGNRT
jgi:hypothetical protein